MPQQTVAIACDHAGFPMKSVLRAELERAGHQVVDLGTDSEESVDYPDFGFALADALSKNEADAGVLVCGSGIGISIAANRHPKVRAALVHDTLGAKMCRLHND
ncbi:MAG: RpiB/LacA/LacB family sugar-phosphate isomerase, partial [Rhodospirillales bacterium]|nr:RpiB/LacA/LacB family sugar-phosphate isomerase [Rhodospirillales bacterium]